MSIEEDKVLFDRLQTKLNMSDRELAVLEEKERQLSSQMKDIFKDMQVQTVEELETKISTLSEKISVAIAEIKNILDKVEIGDQSDRLNF